MMNRARRSAGARGDDRPVGGLFAGSLCLGLLLCLGTGAPQRPAVAEVADAVGDGSYGFSVGAYNPSLPLTLDPRLEATYLGGTGEDGYRDVSVVMEPGGTVLVAGSTRSSDFPTTAGAYDGTHNSGCDVFIARFDGQLTTLLAATFFGGSGDDGAWPGVDWSRTASVASTSPGPRPPPALPATPGAYDTSYNGGGDVFVACFSPGLDSLLACTYLGGSAADDDAHLVLGGGNDLYLVGFTASANYPTTVGAYDRTRTGATDAFATRLSRDLTTLMASTYLGGAYDEYGTCVLWDPRGYLYVAGMTNTYGFPTTPGGVRPAGQRRPGGGRCLPVQVLGRSLEPHRRRRSSAGPTPTFRTPWRLGTTGDIFVTGHVQSTGLPDDPLGVRPDLQLGAGDSDDVFVSRLSPNLGQLVASTFLGGSGWDWAITIARDGRGHVFVGGETWSSDFPTTPGSFSGSDARRIARPGGVRQQVRRGPDHARGLHVPWAAAATTWSAASSWTRRETSSSRAGPARPTSRRNAAGYDTTFAGGANRWGGDVVLVRLDSLLTGDDPLPAVEDPDRERAVSLLAVTPNPMGAAASIRFALRRRGPVTLAVYDVRGRRVSTLADTGWSRGLHAGLERQG